MTRTTITYKGLSIRDPAPYGEAGLAWQNNFIAIADTLDSLDTALDTTLGGLVIGTDIQAYSANLDVWSGVAPSADGQSLVAAVDYAAMRGLLGLGTMATQAADDVMIRGGTITGFSDVPIKILAGTQDDETWTAGSNTSVAVDTTTYITGDRSLEITIAAGKTGTAYCNLPVPVEVRGTMLIWLRISDIANANTLAIEMYEDTGATKGYKSLSLTADTYDAGFVNGEWLCVPLNRQQFPSLLGTPTAWGTADNPTYTVRRIRIIGVAGTGDLVVNLGQIAALTPSKAYVILGFDGPYTSAYDRAFADMQTRGWRGVAWAVTGSVGSAGSLTWAQLQAMHAAGWDIASHGDSGAVFNVGTAPATLRADVATAQKKLLANGCIRGSRFHSWMGNAGICSDTSVPLAYAQRMCFACRGGTQAAKWSGYTHPSWNDSVPGGLIPLDWYNLPFLAMYTGSTTEFDGGSPSLKDYLDQAIIDRHVLNLYTHRIMAVPDAGNISTEMWADLLDYLDEKVAAGLIDIITISDWMDIVRLLRVGVDYDGRQVAMDSGGATIGF